MFSMKWWWSCDLLLKRFRKPSSGSGMLGYRIAPCLQHVVYFSRGVHSSSKNIALHFVHSFWKGWSSGHGVSIYIARVVCDKDPLSMSMTCDIWLVDKAESAIWASSSWISIALFPEASSLSIPSSVSWSLICARFADPSNSETRHWTPEDVFAFILTAS